MFIAHLSAGYLVAGASLRLSSCDRQTARWAMVLCVVASLLPDLDLIYFYLIDQRQVVHHRYWTHIPIFWLGLYLAWFLLSLIICPVGYRRQSIRLASFVFMGVLSHLILDSVCGGILWGYPVWRDFVVVVDIPSRYPWWVMNFVLHWSFALEILLIGASVYVFFLQRLPRKGVHRNL